jgi:SPP1 gp7 family putative phage head morphogenesis protein
MAPDGGSVNDRILDLITDRAINLQRFTSGQRRNAAKFLKRLEGEIVSQLAKIDPTGVQRTTYRSKRLEALLKQVRETIKASYRAEGTRLIGELRELADMEAAFAASSVNKTIGVEIMTVGVTRNQLGALVDGVAVQGAPVAEWWERQAGDTFFRFTDQMRLGIAQGETNGQLVRRVRGGTQNGEVVKGLMQISRQHAESLVRSATQAVSQRARQATYDANEDVLKGLAWASTIDMRTTVDCASRDGLLYSVSDRKPIGHSLPWGGGPGNLHWGCRSTSVPVVKSWQELGFDIDELPPSTRASMDGQIPSDTSFEGWLTRKSKAQQDEYLGKGRAELWREKKLTFRDLVDGNGRELTLEQLRERL